MDKRLLAKSDLKILREFMDSDALAAQNFLTPHLSPRGFTDAEIHELVDGLMYAMLTNLLADMAANPRMLREHLASGDDEISH